MTVSKTIYFQVLSLVCLSSLLAAQSLPMSMQLAENEHILYTNGQASTGLYDESQLRTMQLWFAQTNYWQLMKNNYSTGTDIPATLIVDGDTFPNVGVRFKGQTSYNQTQNSEKKSFNITLDYLDPKQDLMGYETLNLNNCFDDPSFMRELSYLHQIRKHIPAAKAAYVHLYINGTDWGIYPDVQQLNNDFIKEWYFNKSGTTWRGDAPPGTPNPGGGPAWGNGTTALNYLGSDTTEYQQYYYLKSTDQPYPWDDLITVCDKLNNTPPAELESTILNYLDLDRTLWFLASEIAFSDDDSYVYKGRMDYYLHWDAETGRMTPLEYDGNSVMKTNAANWSVFYNETKVNYPLLNRLLAVPSIRQRYLAHMRTLVNDELNVQAYSDMVDQYNTLISAGVTADTKKLYTNTQFNTEKQTIKNFVQTRRTNLLNNSEMNVASPVISNVQVINNAGEAWGQPLDGESVQVTASVQSADGIASVYAYYSPALTGNFSKVQLFDDGQHNDGASADGVFGASLPGFAAETFVRFYLQAKSANNAGTLAFAPAGAEHNVYYYKVKHGSPENFAVVINEVMASNTSTAADEQGEYDDWIELYNKTSSPVDLSGYHLSDNPDKHGKWTFMSGTVIAANGYMIVWADEDSSQGPLHANFKLSSDGEPLLFCAPDKSVLDSISFPAVPSDMGYARVPNGTGPFVIQAPTYKAANSILATHESYGPNEVGVYPSPVSGELYFRLPTDYARVQILDIHGKMLLDQTVENAKSLNVAGLPAGMYIASITLDKTLVTRLFVKN